jgi:Zn-dependent protease
MPDTAAELERATADIPLTHDAHEILDRATRIASERGVDQTAPGDVLKAVLELPNSLADRELQALGFDPDAIGARIQPNGSGAGTLSLRQLLVNANREAQVLGHYQVDSIHLLLAMMYSDSPTTAVPLQEAGLTLYDLRSHLQTGSKAGVPSYRDPTAPDRALRRRPWPSLRGVVSISPIFLGIAGLTAISGALLWTDLLPRYTTGLTILFVMAGFVASVCVHEFGHALVAYLGGDRSVVAAGYLSLNPLRYANVVYSLVLPLVFLLLRGIPLPGAAVYINHSALRTRAWSSAVSLAGPFGTLLCAALAAAPFLVSSNHAWMVDHAGFFGALAFLGFVLAFVLVLKLLTIPGLDGFGVLRPWLPYSLQFAANRLGANAIFLVFIVLWFVPGASAIFYSVVLHLTALGHIDPYLIATGQFHMRLY